MKRDGVKRFACRTLPAVDLRHPLSDGMMTWEFAMMDMLMRRDLLAASALLTGCAMASHAADAAGADPAMTQVVQAGAIPWRQLYNFPAGTAEQATLHGGLREPGQYFVLIRWHPGYMSAPHSYETDRLCIVLSGTWWVASGADFAPDATVPVEAGGFVRRVGGTPHYDGVKKHAAGPAILAISGVGPIHFNLVDRSRPGWREV